MPQVNPDGSVPPKDAPTTKQAKPPSKFWTAVKYLLGGAVVGIAGYEGVRFWRRTVRGDALEGSETGRNPGALPPASPPAPIMSGGHTTTIVPQVMPFPLMPWGQAPAPLAHPPGPPAVANPHRDDDDDEPQRKMSPKERRQAARMRKIEEKLAALEGDWWED